MAKRVLIFFQKVEKKVNILKKIKKIIKGRKAVIGQPPLTFKEFKKVGELNVHGEQEEIWQWQINCIANEWERQMPQNFGLIVGTQAEVEERLKRCVSFPDYFETEIRDTYDCTVYVFRDPEKEYSSQEGLSPKHPIQKGAIRSVSKNMKLIRDNYRPGSPFFVEVRLEGGEFEFHPIKPDEKFTKGERNICEK